MVSCYSENAQEEVPIRRLRERRRFPTHHKKAATLRTVADLDDYFGGADMDADYEVQRNFR